MRLLRLKLVTILTAALATLFATACSSDDPGLLPGDDAQQILTNLERVEDLATNGECTAALESIETISAQIAALPDSVDDRLRQNLRRGVTRLSEVTSASCGESEEATEATTDTDPLATETVPEEDETTDFETETTDEDQGGSGPKDRGQNRGRGNERGPAGGRGQTPSGRAGLTPGTGGGGRDDGPGRVETPQQPGPGQGGGQTQPEGDGDSGGISPEESGEGEATP